MYDPYTPPSHFLVPMNPLYTLYIRPRAEEVVQCKDPALRSISIHTARPASTSFASRQGLTLVQFSAQLERFVWDRGCA